MDKVLTVSANPCLKDYRKQVQALIQKDQEDIGLDTYLQDLKSIKYATGDQQAFIKTNTMKFPQVISNLLKIHKNVYKTGYLSAINRVWLSIGHDLYLWDLESDKEVFRYTCDEPIKHVNLISFSCMHQELVLSTLKHVSLHRIAMEANKLKFTSKVIVDSSGIIMSNLVATDTKRVFMKGDDGQLYELNTLCDTSGRIVQCKIHRHTANALLYYLPSRFKSTPESPIVSMVLDDEAKLLYMLLEDASIHLVNVQGSQYLPLSRYKGTKLASIHLIPSSESKQLNLMAVAHNGDRLYFTYQKPNIIYKYTLPAPPLPGHLMFNQLTSEKSELSFYQPGVFITSLCKSEVRYIVFTSANAIETSESQHMLIEDVYHELFSKKIWSIMESTQPLQTTIHHFKTTTEYPDSPQRQFSVLTEDGIIQYTKQRPVNQFEHILHSGNSSALLEFKKRYRAEETVCFGYALACTNQLSEAIQFVHMSSAKEEGLLLYFARIVNGIWNMDLKQESVPQEKLQLAQTKLRALKAVINSSPILTKTEISDLIARSIEAISFITFFYSLEWQKIVSSIDMWDRSYTFADLVTTVDGAILSQEIVLSALSHSKLSNASNGFNYVSSFLDHNCLELIAQENAIYYKGIECLYGARNHSNDKQQALDLALSYFTEISSYLDIARIASLAEEFCTLDDHYGAVKLVFAKYQEDTARFWNLRPIITCTIEKALKNKDGKQVLQKALSLTHEDIYHFAIYRWLKENNYKDVLISLETSLIERFFKTQLIVERERLEYLADYYAHHTKYSLAINCLYDLAMFVDNINVDDRVDYLNRACGYVELSKESFDNVELSLRVAKIQQKVCNALLERTNSTEAKRTAETLSQKLLSAEDLFAQAYTHTLHEQALYLMDLMDKYDFKYAESAWISIIQNCHGKDHIQSKIVKLAEKLYPSISSFPVYILFKILHKYDDESDKDFAFSTLVKAGVPKEVVSDAETTIISE